MGKRSESMHESIASRPASQSTGRTKESPKPWDREKSHEIGCCYPVGENAVQLKSHLTKA